MTDTTSTPDPVAEDANGGFTYGGALQHGTGDLSRSLMDVVEQLREPAVIAGATSVVNTTIKAIKDVKVAKINKGGEDGGGRHRAGE